jgi:hypothetical protein
MTVLLDNENIVQAIGNNNKDFIENPISINTLSLMYENLFPYKISPKILTSPKTVITMSFDGFKQNGRKFKVGNIKFYTLCHMSLVRTNSGLRYDVIYEEIQKIIEEQRIIGFGKLTLKDVTDLTINDEYIGNIIICEVNDFI